MISNFLSKLFRKYIDGSSTSVSVLKEQDYFFLIVT